MAKKSFLDSIKVPAPCDKNWEDMTGSEQKRFCGGCQKNVYNISAMPRREARKLVAQNAGKICIRYARLPNGRVETADRKLYSISRRASAVAAGVIAVTLTISAMTEAQTVSKTPNSFSVTQIAPESASQTKISITVTDQNGAIVPNARIILTDKNGNSVEGISNEQGLCEFTKISPSIYEIKVSIDGFKPLVKSDLNFTGEKTLEISLGLEAALSSESNISDDQAITGTTSSDISTPITSRQLEELPRLKNGYFLGLVAGNTKTDKTTSLFFKVYDQLGAVIPDTRIKLRNQKTKDEFNLVTNQEGIGKIDLIPFGKYLIFAVSSINGFEDYCREIEVNKKNTLNIKVNLKVKVNDVMGDFTIDDSAKLSAEKSSNDSKFVKNKRRNTQSYNTSQISFTIYDPNDDVIPNAQVKLIDQKTKAEFIAVTDQNGVAQFGLILHGLYDLKVLSPGFNNYQQIILIKESVEPNIKITLDVGPVTGDFINYWSEIPLFQAIIREDNNIVEELINSGFNINTKDSSGKTALHIAVEHENLEIVRFLLEKSAKVNTKDKNKISPLLMLEDNLDEKDENTVEILRLLIAKGANVNARNIDKQTLLMLACDAENLEIAKMLLEAKAAPNLKDENGETALQKTDSDEIKHLLINYGAH